MTTDSQLNQDKNKDYYEKLYDNYDIEGILYWIKNLEEVLPRIISTNTTWNGLYKYNFQKCLKGKKVLEMGCGDCSNAAVMAALGAEVYANDIASASGIIVNKLNNNYDFKHPIRFIEGDFLENSLASGSFDFVIGKAFLHHLTIPVEKSFIKETARLLKAEGEARFFEPAVNSKILDELRWHIPVPGRPSKFNKKAFRIWKEQDVHPDRSLNSRHFENVGRKFFKETEIIPVGTLERFHRIIPGNRFNSRYRRWALKNERFLPSILNIAFARSQLIIYRNKL
ncbi:class I SAM-dependent methyltransferase [Christiangramia sediminis]|uniref:Class I SAM-dependent methyltransferase n=1 Tax=Christiangramia sediminis TaxID=2881336 RepID=A0A9X1LJ84_9FLAO|nr:class I SAM-dependent methyltransferase [Christiangramia sediminis]MCB7481320.1 class I SAM-dependent methyltransferase [Christiangramia sediminis]